NRMLRLARIAKTLNRRKGLQFPGGASPASNSPGKFCDRSKLPGFFSFIHDRHGRQLVNFGTDCQVRGFGGFEIDLDANAVFPFDQVDHDAALRESRTITTYEDWLAGDSFEDLWQALGLGSRNEENLAFGQFAD